MTRLRRSTIGLLVALPILCVFLLYLDRWSPGLDLGETQVDQLVPGKETSYRVDLDSRQFVSASIGLRGGSAWVLVANPSGERIASVFCPADLVTPVSWWAILPGKYRIQVKAEQICGSFSSSTLKLLQIREAMQRDSQLLEAQSLRAQGDRLIEMSAFQDRDETPLHIQEAIGKFLKALTLWKDLGEARLAVDVLRRLGNAHHLMGDPQTASARLQESIQVCRDNGLIEEEATSQNSMGLLQYETGDLRASLATRGEALRLWRISGGPRELAETLLHIGQSHSDLGEFEDARTVFEQALKLWGETDQRWGQARTLIALARLESREGNWQNSLDLFDRAERLKAPLGERTTRANISSGRGYVFESLGEPATATEYYSKAVALFRQVADCPASLSRRDEPEAVAQNLFDLGRAQFLTGEVEQALQSLERARQEIENQKLNDERTLSYILREIGWVLYSLGEIQPASKAFDRALTLFRREGDRRGLASTLNRKSELLMQLGDLAKAASHAEEALASSRKAGDRPTEISTLYNLARVDRQQGKTGVAIKHLARAISLTEQLRANVVEFNLRSTYFATVQRVHRLYVDLLMQSDEEAMAFEASERLRARSFLEMASLPHSESERGAGRFRGSSRENMDSGNTQPLKLRQIQDQVLDADTLLLEYLLCEERSYLWAVTKTELRSFELLPRRQLEAAAKETYELVTARSSIREGESPGQRMERIQAASQRLSPTAAALAETLLGQVPPEMMRARIVVVADGTLQYVPFGALPIPSREEDSSTDDPGQVGATSVPLIVNHEVMTLPSASTLGILRSGSEGRSAPSRQLAVFADPVFTMEDARLSKSPEESKPAPGLSSELTALSMLRAVSDVGLGRFRRLEHSGKEAVSISKLAPAEGTSRWLGFEANREKVINGSVKDHRFLHFATHGLLDSQRPELSGIVLSLYDAEANPVDGFLRLRDIYNLNLSAELVVLSACQTALGREISGEGLIGLTRGFLYAGARRVVASLWKVDDEATEVLMKHFYAAIFKRCLGPGQALREAQLSMLREARWRDPYYWAGFTLQGEWRWQNKCGELGHPLHLSPN